MTRTNKAVGHDECEDPCQYIHSLPDDRLGWLISNPILSQDILDHAAFCDECGQRVESISREQANDLPAEITAACEQLPGHPVAAADKIFGVNNTSFASLDRRALPLAASMQNPARRAEDVVLFGRCEIAGQEFAFLEEQSDGRVLLRGPIPTDATHLQLGSHLSGLKSTSFDNARELEDISSLEIERFLKSNEQLSARFVTQAPSANE